MDVTKDNHDEAPGLDASSKTNSETDHIVIEKVSLKPSVNVEEVSFDESPISGISTTSSSTGSIDQTKPTMTRRQLFTVIVLCFINLLKYMDRFTIAGTSISALIEVNYSIHSFLQEYYLIFNRLSVSTMHKADYYPQHLSFPTCFSRPYSVI